jgi:formylglycine-generating enzyme
MRSRGLVTCFSIASASTLFWPAIVLSLVLEAYLAMKTYAATNQNCSLPESMGTSTDATDEGRTYISKSTGMKFVRVKAGQFIMGSSREEQDYVTNKYFKGERPKWLDDEAAHPVRLSKAYFLAVHEVTRGEFRKFVKDSNYKTEREKDGKTSFGSNEATGTFDEGKYNWLEPGFAQTDDHPVVCVTWNDTVEFCKWMGARDARKYRLPTEAEWEYACRSGTKMHYWFGNTEGDLVKYENVADATALQKFPDWNWTISGKDGFVFTAPVGSYKASSYGLRDMHGNVWEWCSDWYSKYSAGPATDPRGPTEGTHRVRRGGSWGDRASDCRSASRNGTNPSHASGHLGFRVALTPDA